MGLLATADNPAPRSITADDLGKLTVLDAIVHESLRLMPTAPNGGLRVLTSDTKARRFPCMTPKRAPLQPPPPPSLHCIASLSAEIHSSAARTFRNDMPDRHDCGVSCRCVFYPHTMTRTTWSHCRTGLPHIHRCNSTTCPMQGCRWTNSAVARVQRAWTARASETQGVHACRSAATSCPRAQK